MERNIEIVENLILYLQEKIDNGEHKIIYNDLMYDEKTIDCINALKELLLVYKNEKDRYIDTSKLKDFPVIEKQRSSAEKLREFRKRQNEKQLQCNENKGKNEPIKTLHLKLNPSFEYINMNEIKEMLERVEIEKDKTYIKFLESNKTDLKLHNKGLILEGKKLALQELMQDTVFDKLDNLLEERENKIWKKC